VLTVAKVTAKVAAGYADYLEGKTTATSLGDYYLKDGERVEAPGRWVSGATAIRAERSAPVTGRELRELMAVRHPGTGGALRPVGANGEAVAAIDATFSAPKSVSAAWALADPALRARIEQAHEAAIDRTLRYASEQVAMVRERIDRKTVIHTTASDVVATSWRHTTARAVDGNPPDPQLHSHVLLHAAVRRDGKLVAIDSRAWLLHRRELGAAYRTELARKLTRLGFEIERGTGRGGRYFEIAGIPRQLIDRWSSRDRQIREAIEARLTAKRTELLTLIENGDSTARERLHAHDAKGRLAPGEDRMIRVLTRAGKQPATSHELDRVWHATARDVGFDRTTLGRLQVRPGAAAGPVGPEVLMSALTEFDATFSDREARAVALESSAGAPIQQALELLDQARDEGEVLRLADGRSTTRWHRAAERVTVRSATQLTEATTRPIPAGLIDRAALLLDDRLAGGGGRLSAEQRRALMLACGDQQLVMIEGQAGTGKSTVLQAVALAHQADGRHILVTSTAALAANRLATDLADVGVNAASYSTAALHHAIQSGQTALTPATTVIHDEAALASTREQHQLLQAVEDAGARLVLVGDPRQSQAVGAGGLWPHLERASRDQGAHVELTRNLRAHNPADRRDQQLFRDGEHDQAIRNYASRSRVLIAPDQQAAEDRALEAAHTDRRHGRQTLVIAQTSNDHLDELNARAQAIRHEYGELGDDGLPVPGRPYTLHAGDEVQLRHTIRHPDHGRLRNGTTATITGIDTAEQTARIRLIDDTDLQLDRQQLDLADVRLAYVQHPFPAQGVTTDTAHLIVSDHTTREGTYVAITRARQHTHIHASLETLTTDNEQQPLPRLAEILRRTEPDLPSIAVPIAPDRSLIVEAQPAKEIERDDYPGWEL
jgi:conjugative relaxase-like TrwC/TraI family protein